MSKGALARLVEAYDRENCGVADTETDHVTLRFDHHASILLSDLRAELAEREGEVVVAEGTYGHEYGIVAEGPGLFKLVPRIPGDALQRFDGRRVRVVLQVVKEEKA